MWLIDAIDRVALRWLVWRYGPLPHGRDPGAEPMPPRYDGCEDSAERAERDWQEDQRRKKGGG
jgi:hypothetical protein